MVSAESIETSIQQAVGDLIWVAMLDDLLEDSRVQAIYCDAPNNLDAALDAIRSDRLNSTEKSALIKAMQGLPLPELLRFIDAIFAHVSRAPDDAYMLEVALFPGNLWSIALEVNYENVQLRAALAKLHRSPVTTDDVRDGIDRILDGRGLTSLRSWFASEELPFRPFIVCEDRSMVKEPNPLELTVRQAVDDAAGLEMSDSELLNDPRIHRLYCNASKYFPDAKRAVQGDLLTTVEKATLLKSMQGLPLPTLLQLIDFVSSYAVNRPGELYLLETVLFPGSMWSIALATHHEDDRVQAVLGRARQSPIVTEVVAEELDRVLEGSREAELRSWFAREGLPFRPFIVCD